ncbi:MAG: hypothetical protein EB829_07065 [Nitrosopumilus sp. H8]|nr:MAG: hypothetical protein EB829_07065 [Nitrosopumilus sp. H8]RNJ77918.1 MAG: hypothetical protein EB830_01075 [Nitrosopumilus sp. H13]
MLLELLSDLLDIDDVLFVVRSGGATSEIKNDRLKIRRKERWITLGQNDDPAHMHVDSEAVFSAEFIQEERPGRTSYSVRFFDENKGRILAAFFTKMYDESGMLIPEKKAAYDGLAEKYQQRVEFKK